MITATKRKRLSNRKPITERRQPLNAPMKNRPARDFRFGAVSATTGTAAGSPLGSDSISDIAQLFVVVSGAAVVSAGSASGVLGAGAVASATTPLNCALSSALSGSTSFVVSPIFFS